MTRIAQGTLVVGRVSGTTELVIEGELEGEVALDGHVSVGEHGSVRGQITARAVHVAGKVTGDVRGHERVEVARSGNIEGDIAAPRVIIAEGAFFKGKVEMSDGSARRPKASPQAVSRDTPAAAAPGGAETAGPVRRSRDLFAGQGYGSEPLAGSRSEPGAPTEPGRGGE